MNITSGEAIALADFYGKIAPPASITYACRKGHIVGASKAGRDWMFSEKAFLYWLHNRPKRGRKPKGTVTRHPDGFRA